MSDQELPPYGRDEQYPVERSAAAAEGRFQPLNQRLGHQGQMEMASRVAVGAGSFGAIGGSPRPPFAPAPDRPSMVPVSLSRLADQVTSLHMTLNTLEDRLSPIAHSAITAPAGQRVNAVDPLSSVPLVNAIEEIHRQVGDAQRRIEELLQRIKI